MSCNAENGGLKQFERNKYFYGKLMTVLDFEAEQNYFNDKRHLLNRAIHGNGIVFGLEIENPKIKDEKLIVTLSPGLALDCCGNEIVVGMENSGKELEVDGEINKYNALYLKYDQCGKELDSVVSDISTCEESYCHNRIKETFKLVIEEYVEDSIIKPIFPPIKRIETIATIFNKHQDVVTPFENIKEPKIGDIFKVFENLSQDYYDEYLKACPECEDPKVFLAVIDENGKIVPEDTKKCREIVYNNPMLYDLLNGHLIDFNNPHKVTPEKIGALKSINGVSGDSNSNINLVKGSNILIEEDVAKNSITVSVDPAISNQIPNVSKYLCEKVLISTFDKFKELGEKLYPRAEGIAATKISDFAKSAMDNKSYMDENNFMRIIRGICAQNIDDDVSNDLEKGKISDKLKGTIQEAGISLRGDATVSKVDTGYIINNKTEFPVMKEDESIRAYTTSDTKPLFDISADKSDSELNKGVIPADLSKKFQDSSVSFSEKATISNIGLNRWVVSEGEDLGITKIGGIYKFCIYGLYQMELALLKELESLKIIIGTEKLNESLTDLGQAIASGNLMDIITAQEEVCFYASLLEKIVLLDPGFSPVLGMSLENQWETLDPQAKTVLEKGAAAKVLDQVRVGENITNDQIAKNIGIAQNEVDTTLGNLKDNKIVSQNSAGGFVIKKISR